MKTLKEMLADARSVVPEQGPAEVNASIKAYFALKASIPQSPLFLKEVRALFGKVVLCEVHERCFDR